MLPVLVEVLSEVDEDLRFAPHPESVILKEETTIVKTAAFRFKILPTLHLRDIVKRFAKRVPGIVN